MDEFQTEVLVVGGGTGGTAAALQSARRGAKTILVSEYPWLGGMLTAAGVTAPDGNELLAFQTGIWGAFLRELSLRQPDGLDHAWVSFFTYEPRIGAQIFADWVRAEPNLHWISGAIPKTVTRQGDRLTQIEFEQVEPGQVTLARFTVRAEVILDGTELGDVLALAEVPHRWGWDWLSDWNEPSAPLQPNLMTQRYPVQAPTWVVVLQEYDDDNAAPIPKPAQYDPDRFADTWKGYGPQQFLNYGRSPQQRFMINWPQQGNDYGQDLDRLVQSDAARRAFLEEALQHSQGYAHFLQTELGPRYGLADVFPRYPGQLGGGAYALHPYYRESRRLQGLVTIREQDILPQGSVAALPINDQGEVEAIALGNYANDHHYPGFDFPLQPKSIRWGGRWTGTPFTIPYRSLIPAVVDGLLVCEKNISVSHMANGATRLQPVVLGIGQAAGMAAALCVEQGCQPRDLSVSQLQAALLSDAIAPAAVIPLFNLLPNHPDWRTLQHHYLQHPEQYPTSGNGLATPPRAIATGTVYVGQFQHHGPQDYRLILDATDQPPLQLVTLHPGVNQQLQALESGQALTVWGRFNASGNWLLVEQLEVRNN